MNKRLPTALTALVFLFCVFLPRALSEMPSNRATAHYALLIGQPYENSGELQPLPGCKGDVYSFEHMLDLMDATPYETVTRFDLNADEILSEIANAYRSACPGDVCLFYYSGHGHRSDDAAMNGALVGADNRLVALYELISALDACPGDKIVILDSCYSGSAVSVIGDMSLQTDFYIICAAGADEQSRSLTNHTSDASFGILTRSMLYGCGYDAAAQKALSRLPADRDRDGSIALTELYYFAKGHMRAYTSAQHIAVYPDKADFVLWGRKTQ